RTMTMHTHSAHEGRRPPARGDDRRSTSVVLQMAGVRWASSKSVAEATLLRQPGVLAVDANPAAQTVTVRYDPTRTTLRELRDWIRECGYHCTGQSVPHHICEPMTEAEHPHGAVHGAGGL